jgi:phosphoglycerol transferase MdoB-like AlkP superfamily enzyme
VAANSLFIVLSLLPFNLFYRNGYQQFLRWLFGITNGVFLAAEFVDVAYFQFTRKRANADLFAQIGGQSDMVKLLPQFVRDFWWVFVLYILIIILLMRLYNRVRIITRPYAGGIFLDWLTIGLLFLASVTLSTIGIRGGLQRVPIDVVNAGALAVSEEVPLVLNTSFTLIKSLNQQPLKELHYLSEDELDKTVSHIHHFKGAEFRKKNVVVIILESFSKEYTRLGRNYGITPFFDSIMDHSLVFANAFSNGTKSIEGIPAILSSLPSLMDNPYINSIYANNAQTSFASLLGREGYETAFFHGGINGTMNFTDWAALAGYRHYFGRNEYNNEEDFDGYWGIWDEPFLQFAARKMSGFRQPFHAAVFTLSSHHPYFVPAAFKNKFKKGSLENAESIQYGDYSLRRFFDTIKKSSWYNNTVFVFVADHTGISNDPFYAGATGNLCIPIAFFEPGNTLTGVNDGIFCQADILPSTLKILGYNKPFFAFGSDAPGNHDCYYYINGIYLQFNDSMSYRYNNFIPTMAYNYRRDTLCEDELLGRHPGSDSIAERRFRAYIQSYNHILIHNRGTYENNRRK